MRYLGIDYGEKRIGLAYGDELKLATPLPAAVKPLEVDRLAHIAEIVVQRRIQMLVVGYPINMDGSVGFKAKEVDAFIDKLEKKFSLPVHRIDERLTSRQAAADMKAAGHKKPQSIKERQAARATGKLDSRAATLLLQDYLDSVDNQCGCNTETAHISVF